jgi:hypothetical protein
MPVADLTLEEVEARCRACLIGGRWWSSDHGVHWSQNTRGRTAAVTVVRLPAGYDATASGISGFGRSPEAALRHLLASMRRDFRRRRATLDALSGAAQWK